MSPQIQVFPVRRLSSGERCYSACLTFQDGAVLGLQATVTEGLYRRLANMAGKAMAWTHEHVQLPPFPQLRDVAGWHAIEGCDVVPGACPRDILGSTFTAVAEGLGAADGYAAQYAELMWSWDEYMGKLDGLLPDLLSTWIDVAAGPVLTLGPRRVRPTTTMLLAYYAAADGSLGA